MVSMRKLYAWLGVATLYVLTSTSSAHADDVLKPYVVFAFDTSGSMSTATGAGPSSCGGPDTRLNHARCAVNKIINSYGDMVFALGRFRTTSGGTTTAGTFPAGCCANGPDVGAGGGCGAGPVCNATSDMFEMFTGLVDGANSASEVWTNFTGNTCTATGTDPEIWNPSGNTPLEGTLRGTKQYWLGLQDDGVAAPNFPVWPSANPGFDPIRNDPTNTSFLPANCDPSPACVTNCCAEQCRPYIVILLTDGAETCGGTPANGATSMITTDVDGRRYRVETKPIGFGIAPGNAQIEAIAHGGGAVDVPGVNEGAYASNESDLQLAISRILADSVRAEVCNDLDDDCDTFVDEDFPNKGGTCTNGQQGICLRTGTLECTADGTGLQCNAVTVTPGTEGPGCNQMDDDCDGRIDEGLSCQSCIPTGELCNNADDDCDTFIDEGLTRACGQGTCTGTEVCTAGTWGGCTAPPVGMEVCDGLDNDCDGVCDGLQAGCSEVNGMCNPNNAASCPQTDSPGDPGHYTMPDAGETMCMDAIDNDLDGLINDGCAAMGAAETMCADAMDNDGDGRINDGCPVPPLPIAQNICQPGARVCPVLCSVSGNSYGQCSGEVLPLATDPCNGLDDDCDNKIDEGFVPADCSTNCGVGQTTCVNGMIQCNSTPATDDTTCNNVDDDCDNMIDEDWICANPVNGVCPCGSGMVCDGLEKCINGVVVCQGTPIGTESCNCLDEDCDTRVDEGVMCPAGGTCVNCQCAFACAGGEFPCPLGKKCDTSMGPPGFCVNDPCFNVMCPAVPSGNAQTCVPKPGFPNEPLCVDTCTTVTCSSPLICYQPTGECRPDDCTTFPERCTGNQVCVNGVCESNPCDGVQCPGDKYCLGGTCVGSCADIDCPQGQRCRQGACETDPCGHPCPFGFACNDTTGQCIEDPCKFRNCPQGQWCNPNDGQCEDDPCVENQIMCPNEGEICRGGTCLDPDDLLPDAANEAHVTVGGGGGCSSTGRSSGLLLAVAVLLMRRRRKGGAA
jgi:hypothetical protein